MKSASRPALSLLLALLLLSPVLRAEDSADVITLRTKAEQGNSIAQYNLGLAYSRGAGTEVDLPEAFVWLTLASENGTKGPALEKTMDALTPSQLSEAKRRLDARRANLAKPATTTVSAPAPAASAPAATVATVSTPAADTAALSAQLEQARQNISRLTLKNQELEAAASHVTASTGDADKKLAETEEKLATSLRSYTLLRDENDQLKAAEEKTASEKTSLASQLEAAQATITALNQQLTSANATAAQATAYHDQLRQTQDQLASVSSENNELRGRLAATSDSSGTVLSSPTRPGAAPTGFNAAPLHAFEPEHAAPVSTPLPSVVEKPAVTPAAQPASAPVIDTSVERTHTVVAGDTLSGIALRYYGNSLRWAEILEANRARLHDEKSLRVGMKLRIPALH